MVTENEPDRTSGGGYDRDGCCDPAELVGDLTGTRSVPAYVATGVRLYSFPVGASFARLRDVCDRYLNAPAPNAPAWRPLGPMLYVQVLHYDRLVSEPYKDLGYIRQNELVFQIPIIPAEPEAPTIGFFSAYLVVDNPLSMTVGREVFGYPKTFGAFRIESTGISVSNWLTPSQGPNAEYAEHPLLGQTGLLPAPPLPAQRSRAMWPLGDVGRLFRPEDAQAKDGEKPAPFELDQLASRMLFDSSTLPIGFGSAPVQALKEIDSTTRLQPGPQYAAYQARVSARTTVTDIAQAGTLASNPLTIHRYDPLDLVDIFGLQTVANAVPVWFPFWMDLDFRIDDVSLLTCHCNGLEP